LCHAFWSLYISLSRVHISVDGVLNISSWLALKLFLNIVSLFCGGKDTEYSQGYIMSKNVFETYY
jgi:hypothetical protein